MPVAYTADPAARFAILTITDPYTIEEWRTALDALLQEPVYRAHCCLLVDRRECAAPQPLFVAQMAEFFADHTRAFAGATAAVVVGSEAGFGMGRMTELKSDKENPDFTIRTFRNYDDAERWLTG